MARKAVSTERTLTARNGKWHYHAVAPLKFAYLVSDLFDHSHELVPKNHLPLLGDKTIVDVQVRSANCGRGHPQDYVSRMLDLGVRHLIDLNVAGPMEYKSPHLPTFLATLPSLSLGTK